MSGQDFEVGVRFNNLGERRNSVSPIGSLMRKFPGPWEKRPHTRGQGGDSGEHGLEYVQRPQNYKRR